MSTTIKLKRSANTGVQPTANILDFGELFLNYADGLVYYKDSTGNIQFLNSAGQASRTAFLLAPVIWGGNPNSVYGGVVPLDGGTPTTDFSGQQPLDASDNRVGI